MSSNTSNRINVRIDASRLFSNGDVGQQPSVSAGSGLPRASVSDPALNSELRAYFSQLLLGARCPLTPIQRAQISARLHQLDLETHGADVRANINSVRAALGQFGPLPVSSMQAHIFGIAGQQFAAMPSQSNPSAPKRFRVNNL